MWRRTHGEWAFTVLFGGPASLGAPGWARGPAPPDSSTRVPRRRGWIGLGATAAGWIVGQLLHPRFLDNLKLLWTTNVTILSQSAAGDSGLRSQAGNELQPLRGDLLLG